ncbi:MAG: hypothetical protein ACLQBD_00980 [Syntrophobacteraceae bacterium]
MRIFKTKWFTRFARKEGISDEKWVFRQTRTWTVCTRSLVFDVEEREDAVAPSSTAAQKNFGQTSTSVAWTRSFRHSAYDKRREGLVKGMNGLRLGGMKRKLDR